MARVALEVQQLISEVGNGQFRKFEKPLKGDFTFLDKACYDATGRFLLHALQVRIFDKIMRDDTDLVPAKEQRAALNGLLLSCQRGQLMVDACNKWCAANLHEQPGSLLIVE